jgi:endoglucanase
MMKGRTTMDQRAFDFLKRLLNTPGPSGYERAPARVWREEASTFADDVYGDVLGNSYARLKAEGGPKVVIEGHIDEIGLLITHIDKRAFSGSTRLAAGTNRSSSASESGSPAPRET